MIWWHKIKLFLSFFIHTNTLTATCLSKYWMFCQSKYGLSYVSILMHVLQDKSKILWYWLDDAGHFHLLLMVSSETSILRYSFSHPVLSLSLPELNQTQSVLAQSFHACPEWRNGEELMVDVEPWGGKEWQVSTPESHFHGQQQQVHEEPRTSSQEKGQLRENACSLGADLLCVKIVVLN